MKYLLTSFVLGMALLLNGCGGIWVYDRHTAGKNDIYSRADNVDHKFVSSPSYEVLGPVTAQGESDIILGLIASGEEGHGLLLGEAQKSYGQDVSTVMHIIADYEYQGILFPIYGTVTTNYHGVAVRMERAENVNTD